MKLGNLVKYILAPFVKGTKYENCEACNERARKLNSWSASVGSWFTKVTCPCFWRSKFGR